MSHFVQNTWSVANPPVHFLLSLLGDHHVFTRAVNVSDGFCLVEYGTASTVVIAAGQKKFAERGRYTKATRELVRSALDTAILGYSASFLQESTGLLRALRLI